MLRNIRWKNCVQELRLLSGIKVSGRRTWEETATMETYRTLNGFIGTNFSSLGRTPDRRQSIFKAKLS
jgi:hypothetical protein